MLLVTAGHNAPAAINGDARKHIIVVKVCDHFASGAEACVECAVGVVAGKSGSNTAGGLTCSDDFAVFLKRHRKNALSRKGEVSKICEICKDMTAVAKRRIKAAIGVI